MCRQFLVHKTTTSHCTRQMEVLQQLAGMPTRPVHHPSLVSYVRHSVVPFDARKQFSSFKTVQTRRLTVRHVRSSHCNSYVTVLQPTTGQSTCGTGEPGTISNAPKHRSSPDRWTARTACSRWPSTRARVVLSRAKQTKR